MMPSWLNSKMVKPSCPACRAMESTSRLVEVPIRVHTPPNWAAYDSGIRNFDGGSLLATAAAMISGRNTATAAVLLMNADTRALSSIITSASSQPQRIRAMVSPSRLSDPLRCSPALSTNIAATVTVAGLLKPDSASSVLTRRRVSRAASTSIATTSGCIFSLMNSAMAPASTRKVSSMSGVMDAALPGRAAEAWSSRRCSPAGSKAFHFLGPRGRALPPPSGAGAQEVRISAGRGCAMSTVQGAIAGGRGHGCASRAGGILAACFRPARHRLPSPDTSRFDVVVVGGGASGALVATHLLGDGACPYTVALVEARPAMAEGVAYSTRSPEHLLNVRAAGMSAFGDRPEDFVSFLEGLPEHAGQDRATLGARFMPRMVYARYLAALAEGRPGLER